MSSPARPLPPLSRREREIMEVVYRLGRATAAEVRRELDDPPSHSAVRSALWLLEDKGHLRHEQDGPRNVYVPTVPRDAASSSAVRSLLETFFGGSRAQAVAAILGAPGPELAPDEVARIEAMLAQARAQDGADRDGAGA